MRKIFIILCMALFTSGVIKAQVGLQAVTIETYYVANATDIAFAGVDPLPAGAKTYRVYVDMAPGWELQAIFGATNIGTGEVDTLVVRSTTPFWNHTDFGALYGYGVQANKLPQNTVGLDSWFSTGRSSGSTGGTSAVLEVLPTEDSNGAAPTHPHTPVNLLQNNDPAAGLPLTTEDGNIPFTSTITWTPTPGIETILDPVFNNVNSPATQVVVTDGALGVTVSLQGPTASNRVCIGQFTTAGVFSGQINLQLRNTTTNVVEVYVARTPQSGQFTHADLIWGPNALPSVTITSPTEAQNFTAPTTVNFNATASDSDGSITQVQYYLNGAAFGAPIPAPGPYNTTFPTGLSSGTYQLVARATDNDGGTASDTVNFTVAGNAIPVVTLTAPSTAISGTTVNISATATDADGIASIQFFFNNVALGAPIPSPGPYSTSFVAPAPGSYNGLNGIRAVALDNVGGSGSASQNLVVTANALPATVITAPGNGSFLPAGNVTITATTTDANGNGTVTQVEFFVNGVSIGVDNTGPGPWSIVWPATFVGPFGANTLTAQATDNFPAAGPLSAPVNVNIINPLGSPYAAESVNQVCNPATVCIPIKAISAISNVIGFDMVIEWDNSKVFPTGNVVKSSDFMNPNFFETDNNINLTTSKMLLSVFLDTDAPVGTTFTGTGDIVCVEFAKRPGFSSVDTATIEVTNMQESYFNGVQLQNPVPPSTFTTYRDTVFTSQVIFWQDGSPIGNNTPVNIQGNTSFNCDLSSAANPASLAGPVVNTDVNGFFTYNFSVYPKLSFGKDIAGTTDVQEVINGFDALLTRRLIIDDASFTPSIFQAIAMDVNRDGVVSAGDVSQINQRAVLFIPEFKQKWNYTAAGAPIPGMSASKDWQFIDNSTVAFSPAYQISSAFPNDNGVGYSKHRVPQVPFCLTAPVTNFSTCPNINEEIYTGILYGDINGNYRNSVNVLIRTSDAVTVGVGQAQYTENYVDVPVSFQSTNDIYSIDLNLQFNGSKLAYQSILANNMEVLGYFNENDGKLRITSNSLNSLPEGETAFVVRFTKLTNDQIHASDFGTAAGYLNGDKVNVNLIAPKVTPKNDNVYFNVYPNPTNDYIFIGIDMDVKAEIVDMNGRILVSNISVSANSAERVDVSSLPTGIYMIRVFGDDYTSTQRVIISK